VSVTIEVAGFYMTKDNPRRRSMEMATPQTEHKWLQRFVGEWTSETEMSMEPGKAPEKCYGTDSVRSLGGLWILAEGQGDMPGCGPLSMVLTLGYDPQRGRFVGTWIGSMMTHLWVYDGSLDAAQRMLTLEAEGPSMEAPESKMGKYRDVMEFTGNDHRVLTSYTLGADGSWHKFMTVHYQRKK
jgi:Protein of unknown function (DUF1579)